MNKRLYSCFYYFGIRESFYRKTDLDFIFCEILPKNIVCPDCIGIKYIPVVSEQSPFDPVLSFCVFPAHFRRIRTALTGIRFFLKNHTDPVQFKLVRKHPIDSGIRKTVKLLIHLMSEIGVFADIFDITSHHNRNTIILLTVPLMIFAFINRYTMTVVMTSSGLVMLVLLFSGSFDI